MRIVPFVLLVLNFLYRDSHVQTPQLIGIFGCVFPQKEFPCEDRSAAMQCPDLELFSRVIYEQIFLLCFIFPDRNCRPLRFPERADTSR